MGAEFFANQITFLYSLINDHSTVIRHNMIYFIDMPIENGVSIKFNAHYSEDGEEHLKYIYKYRQAKQILIDTFKSKFGENENEYPEICFYFSKDLLPYICQKDFSAGLAYCPKDTQIIFNVLYDTSISIIERDPLIRWTFSFYLVKNKMLVDKQLFIENIKQLGIEDDYQTPISPRQIIVRNICDSKIENLSKYDFVENTMNMLNKRFIITYSITSLNFRLSKMFNSYYKRLNDALL